MACNIWRHNIVTWPPMMMGPYWKWAFLLSLTFETILNCPIVLQRLEVIYVYAVQLQKIRQSSSKYMWKVWFWREIPPSPLNQCWKSTKESWLTFPISICNIMIVLHKQWHWYQHWLRGRGGFFTRIPFFHNFLTMIVFNSINGSSEYL